MLSIEKITQVLVTKWQMEEHFVPFLQTNNRWKTVKKMNYVLALIFKRCLCNIIAAPTNTIDVAKDNTIITSNENVLIEKVFEIEPFWLDTN